MTLATLEHIQQGTLQQLYSERGLLAQLAARLAAACGYPISLVPDPDETLVDLTLGLPTGPITIGLPPDAVRLGPQEGPAPVPRQTMRERRQSLEAFLDASG